MFQTICKQLVFEKNNDQKKIFCLLKKYIKSLSSTSCLKTVKNYYEKI